MTTTNEDAGLSAWAPERIWLQNSMGDDGSHTWCSHPVGDNVTEAEYVRADLAPSANVQDKREANHTCPTCKGLRVVDDGEITGSGGVDYENGPIKCLKDCPDCAASTSANVAQGAEAAQFVFPPMPPAVVMHDKLGPLFDRLSMQFYADKCMRIAAPPAPPALTDAAREVLGERQRQVTAEGWTPTHDDEHEIGELARAAACYAANATGYRLQSRINIWPWDREWWKPSTPRRDLIKAGALILAEIERLDRRALTAAQSASGDKA